MVHAEISPSKSGCFSELIYIFAHVITINALLKMKQLCLLIGTAVLGILLVSCSAQKRVWYLQDAQPFTPEQIAENGQIRIKPLDRLTIVVNSKDPELAVPFNSATSYNSLTGTNISGAANSQALQMRTVDENGMLEMPVIGKIECKGKTRSELAQAIAKKIIDGGYINDPTVNVQFADMKISVIGEVARPGFYDVTRDKVSIFDALAMAGDMTIYGVRDNVKLIREDESGKRKIINLDLNNAGIVTSPYYYLKQNDILYVTPNETKAKNSDIGNSTTLWVSSISILVSIAGLLVNILK